MKVLEKGTPQKGPAVKAVCTGNGNGGGGCKAKLLVEEDDVFSTESHCRDESTTYTTFRCAECGTLTDLGAGHPFRSYPEVNKRAKTHGFRWVSGRLVPKTPTDDAGVP
jgi:hypothetical protein